MSNGKWRGFASTSDSQQGGHLNVKFCKSNARTMPIILVGSSGDADSNRQGRVLVCKNPRGDASPGNSPKAGSPDYFFALGR